MDDAQSDDSKKKKTLDPEEKVDLSLEWDDEEETTGLLDRALAKVKETGDRATHTLTKSSKELQEETSSLRRSLAETP